MITFISDFLSDPLYYVGYIFAFGGAAGFLLFCRGFFSGIGHVMRQDANVDHMDHYRTRAVQGVLIMSATLGAWESLRWIFSWFGVGHVDGIAIFASVCGILFWLWKLFFAKPAAH